MNHAIVADVERAPLDRRPNALGDHGAGPPIGERDNTRNWSPPHRAMVVRGAARRAQDIGDLYQHRVAGLVARSRRSPT
jgi:hypothetical protein